MQTLRGEYYLKHDFGFYDSGILPVVGFTLPWVYDVLRRFVWRSLQTGDAEMRTLYARGFLAAKVRQKLIGEYLGLSRQQICLHVANLKALGWLKSLELNSTNGMPAYVLGEVLKDGLGRSHEVFYADASLRDLWDGLCARATEIQGATATPLDLPMEQRIAYVHEVLDPLLSTAQTINESVEAQSGGCQENQTPPVKSTLHPLSRKPDTPCQVDLTLEGREGLKEAKIEGREHLPQGRQEVVTSLSTIPFYAPPVSEDFEDRIRILKEAQAQRTAEHLKADSEKKSKLSNLKGKEPPVSKRKVLGELSSYWHELIRQTFPDSVIPPWDSKGKEFKQLSVLVEKYNADIVRNGIAYVILNWEKLRERLFKGQGLTPTLGMVLKLHDSLLLESQQYAISKRIIAEVNALLDKDPYVQLPEELDAKYKRAQSDLKAIGMDE